MQNRRKFIGLLTGSTIIGLSGCISSENETKEIEYNIEDENINWDVTNNVTTKNERDSEVILDFKENDSNLIIYISAMAPQSNYKLKVTDVYLEQEYIIIDGIVTGTGSEIGLTQITQVNKELSIPMKEEYSKIIFNVKDGFYDSYSIETTI